VNVSIPNCRLFLGNIPKSKTKEDIQEEISKVTGTFSLLIIGALTSVCPCVISVVFLVF